MQPKKSKDPSVYASVVSFQENQIRRTIQISLLCIVLGIITGLGTAAFKYLIDFFHNLFFNGTFSFSFHQGGNASRWGAFIILVPAIGIYLSHLITTKLAPDAKGHGVPEVMVAVSENGGKIPPMVGIVKTIASAITIGAGGSLGKEGPIIQIGASFGSTVGQMLKLSSRETIILVGAGVAGGIGATFNAPIGGIMLALELILPEYSIMTIMPLVVASIISTAVCSVFLGTHPAFIIPEYAMVSSTELLFYAVLGLLAGLLSVLFIKTVYSIEDLFKKLPIPPIAKALVGGVCVGAFGYFSLRMFGSYHVFGLGSDFMGMVLSNKITSLVMALSLVALKIFASSITMASGGSGGIFAPAMFLGAGLGAAVGIAVNFLFPGSAGPISAYAIVGMAALISGVTGAVLTAIILVFEMTRNYAVMMPLLLGSVISYFVSRLIFGDTMYTKGLTRNGIHIQFDKLIPIFKTVSVSEIMKKDLIACSKHDTVKQVWALMHEKGLGLLPVVEGSDVVGTIGYLELHEALDDVEKPIESLLRKVDISIPGNADLYEALQVMETEETNILVVKQDDAIVGFVTANRIIRKYLEKKRLS